jgi:hypothetical protein
MQIDSSQQQQGKHDSSIRFKRLSSLIVIETMAQFQEHNLPITSAMRGSQIHFNERLSKQDWQIRFKRFSYSNLTQ